jgi:8-hydroxy-5-deazaflavin:NADPH oxidoreductase
MPGAQRLTMKIGILGSGYAGQTLGRGFAARGYEVRIGTRDPAKLEAWRAEIGPAASVTSGTDCARWADLIVISIRGTAVEDVLRAAGIEHFAGKLVIDASDPLVFDAGRPGLFVGTTDSLGERVQRWLPEAKVVKALNTVFAAVMVEPTLSGGDPDLFIAGNDADAKQRVRALLGGFGWSVIDIGDIQNARWLEAMSLLWVVYHHQTGKLNHAFKLLGK